jgi:hypothetical protein
MTQTAEASTAAPTNLAVARCLEAWERSIQEQTANKKSFTQGDASKAYCSVMPTLFGYENIRDFIACTTQGILIGAINETRSTKLLYSAQIALSASRLQPSPRKPGA